MADWWRSAVVGILRDGRIRSTIGEWPVPQLIFHMKWVAERTTQQLCYRSGAHLRIIFPTKWVAERSIPQLCYGSGAQLWNAPFRNSFHTRRNPPPNHKPHQILYKSKNTSYIPQIILKCVVIEGWQKWKWSRKCTTEQWLYLEAAQQKWSEERFVEK